MVGDDENLDSFFLYCLGMRASTYNSSLSLALGQKKKKIKKMVLLEFYKEQ